MKHSREKNIRGFTLVELIMTLIIAITVMVIAVPYYQIYAMNTNLKAAARDLVGDIMNMKERAIAENATYTILIDIWQNRYTIQPTGQIKKIASFGKVNLYSTNLPGNKITFQTRGTMSAGDIVLANNRGSKATITTLISGRTYVAFTLK